MVLEWATTVFTVLSPTLNKIVLGTAVLLSGFILGKVLERILFKILIRIKYDDFLSKQLKRRRHYARATRTTIVYIVYILTVILALRQLGLAGEVTSIVLGIFTIILLVSIFLTLKEFIPNYVASRTIKEEVGTRVKVITKHGTVRGKIVRKTATDVQLREEDQILFIPNVLFVEATVKKV